MRIMVNMADGTTIDLKGFGDRYKRVTVYDLSGKLVRRTVTKQKALQFQDGVANTIYIVSVEVLP